ncbi:MAG: hypothetical protein ACRDPE_17680 [Solirubrobacterales bacterium]
MDGGGIGIGRLAEEDAGGIGIRFDVAEPGVEGGGDRLARELGDREARPDPLRLAKCESSTASYRASFEAKWS